MIIKKIKNIFFDILVFGTPQAKVFNFSVIILVLEIIPPRLLQSFPHFCIFKNIILPLIFNNNCPTSGIFAQCNGPGCGMTRAISSLLHGRIFEAWNFNKLVFLVTSIILLIIIVNIFESIKIYKKTGLIYRT